MTIYNSENRLIKEELAKLQWKLIETLPEGENVVLFLNNKLTIMPMDEPKDGDRS